MPGTPTKTSKPYHVYYEVATEVYRRLTVYADHLNQAIDAANEAVKDGTWFYIYSCKESAGGQASTMITKRTKEWHPMNIKLEFFPNHALSHLEAAIDEAVCTCGEPIHHKQMRSLIDAHRLIVEERMRRENGAHRRAASPQREAHTTTYVIAPATAKGYITTGKLYKALPGDNEISFRIKDDRGSDLFCLWKSCAHLDGGDWIKVEYTPELSGRHT